ncbi:MAG TPA: 6-phosphogluconolactonase [Pyrinomonadaceae bacterium]|nr:6-phosphogluconolactonase [Pyrinomonadaceae bacterium]
MSTTTADNLARRIVGRNVWLRPQSDSTNDVAERDVYQLKYEVVDSEAAVGRAQLEEIRRAAREKTGDLVIILLGGRGAQALYRLLGELARTDEIDQLLNRLHVFTQDALAPLRMDNGLSFVRDFERLLGSSFFAKVKSFIPMQTDITDLEAGLERYLEKLESLGGIDIFFLGLGPEAEAASHLAYIKPGSGATANDLAGVIPISSSILEHHINKFKVGGSKVNAADEEECRAATHILTLGPAAILKAKRIVQSIVDASTAPGKPESYRRVLETKIFTEPVQRAAQLDENPGLWLRLHGNVRSLILPDVLETGQLGT